MLFKWNSNIKEKKYFDFNGFTLVELLASIIISLAVFWGMMSLFMDVTKNQVKDQLMADIRFNLSMAMDRIADDMKNADSINISTSTHSKKIELYTFNQFGNLIESHSYSAKNDLGILYDNEPIALPGKYLFKDDGPYEITIEDFDCKLALNPFNTSKRNLRDNFFDLIVAFKVKSKADSDYEKLFTFEQQIFSLNQFSITKVEDEDEGEEI